MPPWTLRNASRARAGGAPQHAMRQRAATQPLTQTLIIHVIRTNKISFVQSQASRALTFTTLSIMAFGIWLPYSPISLVARLHPSPNPVLADPGRDYACLRGADSRHQSLAATPEMDLGLRVNETTPSSPGRYLVSTSRLQFDPRRLQAGHFVAKPPVFNKHQDDVGLPRLWCPICSIGVQGSAGKC